MNKIISILFLVFFSVTHAHAEGILQILGFPESQESIDERNAAQRQAINDRRAAEKKVEQERLNADLLAAHEKREAHAEALKNGSISPESIYDLEDLYEYPEDGWDLAANPKLDADDGLYLISGLVERREKGLLLCATLAKPEKLIGDYFAVQINTDTIKPADIKNRLRINSRVYIVGKYNRNLEYNTVAAGQKIMPVLGAVHLIIPEDD
jgi:hypothetical protein